MIVAKLDSNFLSLTPSISTLVNQIPKFLKHPGNVNQKQFLVKVNHTEVRQILMRYGNPLTHLLHYKVSYLSFKTNF